MSGQDETDGRTHVHLAPGPHAASVTFDDAFHQRETNAGTREMFGTMQALKYTEQFADVSHLKTDAVVAYAVADAGGGDLGGDRHDGRLPIRGST